MQLPLGLFGVALGTVTLPLLSRLVVAAQMTAFRAELARAMRLALLLTNFPRRPDSFMLAEPIISVLYQHGKFSAYQARRPPSRCDSTPSASPDTPRSRCW